MINDAYVVFITSILYYKHTRIFIRKEHVAVLCTNMLEQILCHVLPPCVALSITLAWNGMIHVEVLYLDS